MDSALFLIRDTLSIFRREERVPGEKLTLTVGGGEAIGMSERLG